MDAAEKELLDVLRRKISSEKKSFVKTDVKVGLQLTCLNWHTYC